MIGTRENYFIKDGYVIRPDAAFFDDTPFTDEFQRPVYDYARTVAQTGYRVTDVGCGSGFKLLQFFGDLETLGVDLEPTVSFLKDKYPQRKWQTFDEPTAPADLVICSDVIEHVLNPDVLLEYIVRIGAREIVISTPERELLRLGTEDGPPKNLHHVREWTREEFRAYISESFEVKRHFIREGWTQVIHCSPKIAS